MKFTPGPWKLGERDSSLFDFDTIDIQGENTPYWITMVNGEPMLCKEIGEANANLISAAPDLYEALKVMYETVSRYMIEQHEESGKSTQAMREPEFMANARKALDKAVPTDSDQVSASTDEAERSHAGGDSK